MAKNKLKSASTPPPPVRTSEEAAVGVHSPSGDQVVVAARSYQGPLPDADQLAKYKDVDPRFADAIVDAFIKQVDHRHEMERQDLEFSKQVMVDDQATQRLALKSGLAVTVLFLIATVILGLAGEPVLAGVIGGLDLVSLVTVFIVGRRLPQPTHGEE